MCGGRLRSVEGDRARKPRPAAIFPNIPNRDPRVATFRSHARAGWTTARAGCRQWLWACLQNAERNLESRMKTKPFLIVQIGEIANT